MIKMARGMVLLILAADTPRMIQRTPQLPMMAMTRMTVKATVHMAEASVHGSEIGLVVKGKDTQFIISNGNVNSDSDLHVRRGVTRYVAIHELEVCTKECVKLESGMRGHDDVFIHKKNMIVICGV